jgi:hypothetical protein
VPYWAAQLLNRRTAAPPPIPTNLHRLLVLPATNIPCMAARRTLWGIALRAVQPEAGPVGLAGPCLCSPQSAPSAAPLLWKSLLILGCLAHTLAVFSHPFSSAPCAIQGETGGDPAPVTLSLPDCSCPCRPVPPARAPTTRFGRCSPLHNILRARAPSELAQLLPNPGPSRYKKVGLLSRCCGLARETGCLGRLRSGAASGACHCLRA